MSHEPEEKSTILRLVSLAVFLLFFGVLLAIVVPNYLNSVNRAKLKRTMSKLRSIGTAVESYQVDHGKPPNVAGDGADIAVLLPHLEPTYIKLLPRVDPWGSEFKWYHAPPEDEYSIISTGKDDTIDESYQTGPTSSFDADIFYSDGQFTVYPDAGGF